MWNSSIRALDRTGKDDSGVQCLAPGDDDSFPTNQRKGKHEEGDEGDLAMKGQRGGDRRCGMPAMICLIETAQR